MEHTSHKFTAKLNALFTHQTFVKLLEQYFSEQKIFTVVNYYQYHTSNESYHKITAEKFNQSIVLN